MKTTNPIAFLCCLLSLWLVSTTAQAQDIKVIKFNELEQLRQNTSDTLYIVNFWATWCGPCVKELPYFEAANQKYKNQPVKVVLVSMDDVENLQKVKNFATKRKLTSRQLLLDEVDGNSYIDKLEPKWSGAIPATIMFNNKRQHYFFLEGEIKPEQLEQLIQKYKS